MHAGMRSFSCDLTLGSLLSRCLSGANIYPPVPLVPSVQLSEGGWVYRTREV